MPSAEMEGRGAFEARAVGGTGTKGERGGCLRDWAPRFEEEGSRALGARIDGRGVACVEEGGALRPGFLRDCVPRTDEDEILFAWRSGGRAWIRGERRTAAELELVLVRRVEVSLGYWRWLLDVVLLELCVEPCRGIFVLLVD